MRRRQNWRKSEAHRLIDLAVRNRYQTAAYSSGPAVFMYQLFQIYKSKIF